MRCKYERDFVLRLRAREVAGGPMTIREMYLDYCGPDRAEGVSALECGACGARTDHDKQCRVVTAPNVLLVQVRRNPEGVERAERSQIIEGKDGNLVGQGQLVRHPVGVEEHLSLPGGVEMDLVGVVYHNGRTLEEGHYTCLCRGPGGRFWYVNDDYPVQKRGEEAAHIKPREVYLVVYVKRVQKWAQELPAPGGVVCVDEDGRGGGGSAAGSASRRGSTCDTGGRNVGASTSGVERVAGAAPAAETPKKRRLGRKTSGDVGGIGAASPVIREATTPERERKKACLAAESPAAGCEEIEMSPGGSPRAALRRGVEPVSTPRRCRSKTSVSDLCGDLGQSRAAPASEGGPLSPRAVARLRVGEKSPPPVAFAAVQGVFVSSQDVAAGSADRDEPFAAVSGFDGPGAAPSPKAAELPSADADAPPASTTRRGSLLKRRHGASVPEHPVGSRSSARVAALGQERRDLLRAGEGSGARSAGASSGPTRGRIVTGFGSERIDDVRADEQRRLAEGARRGDQRREDGSRGRMTSFEGMDLDRGEGGAWHAGRR